MTLREKVCAVINNRYYVPPGVMAEMIDAILALLSTADSEQREPVYVEETADFAWKEVIAAFTRIWGDDVAYNDSPVELIYRLRDERDDLRRKLASASLANAALREALQQVDTWWRLSADSPTIGFPAPTVAAALALPADGLAEEVKKYMDHLAGCGAWVTISDSTHPAERQSCTCGLDALLAKIGGKP